MIPNEPIGELHIADRIMYISGKDFKSTNKEKRQNAMLWADGKSL